MKLYYSLVLCVAVIFLSPAQEESPKKIWTLDECVDYALENNIQVRQSALQVQVNKNNQNAAKWDYAPNLNASSTYGWNFGLNIDPVTNQISQTSRQTAFMSLSTNWQLFDGGRKYNSIARSNLEYMASLYDLEDAKNNIGLNVSGSYLQVLLNREMLAVAGEQERVTQLQVNRAQKLVEAGSSPRGDLLQLEAQLARDRQNRISAENALTISKLQLANLLQLQNPDEFEVADPDIELPEATLVMRDPSVVYTAALDNQPNIKAAELRVERSEEDVDVSRAGYYPSLSLQGQVSTNYSDQFQEPIETNEVIVPYPSYDSEGNVIFTEQRQTVPVGFRNKPFFDQVGDNVNEYVGVNLNIPIFNRFNVRNNYQNALINKDINELNLEQEKNDLRQSIYQAHADAKASHNSYLAAEKAVESSQESFNYAQQRFEVGALNQFDFENAKNSLVAAQSEMLRAKYDYIFKIKVLEFYLTNEVKF